MQTFAREWIYQGGRVANERPIVPGHATLTQRFDPR